MAKKGKYQIYKDGGPLPAHSSDDLAVLIERADLLHSIFGDHYEVRSMYGVVWSTKEGAKGAEASYSKRKQGSCGAISHGL